MAVIAITAAAATVQSVPDRSNANKYHAAPLCAPGRDSSGCRLVEPAVVERVSVTRAKTDSTVLVLRVTAPRAGSGVSGPPPSQTYTTSFNDDLSGRIASGRRVTLTLWDQKVAEVSDAENSWGAIGGPDDVAGGDAEGIVILLLMCLVPLRIAAWRKHGHWINHTRMIQADVALAALYVAVCVLTAVRLTVATAWVAGATLAALGLVTFWPRLVLRRRRRFAQSEQQTPL